MPPTAVSSRAVIAGHVARKALRKIRHQPLELPKALREVIATSVFFEILGRNFGTNSIIRGRHGFFPHIFLPEYHGPHFDEALRRLVYPGIGPNILYFSLTGKCPCYCEYCFARAGGKGSPDVGEEVILKVAHEVAALRVPLVNISGGEPLSSYRRLVRTVEALANGSEVRLFTAGIGLTPDRLDELRQAGLKGIFVSLDTVDSVAFDAARGHAGAFDAATAALALWAEREILTFINCVVDRQRFRTRGEIAAFLGFVEGIDPRIVVNFLPQLATGRGTEADSFRTPEDCEEVANRIVSTAGTMRRPVSMLFGTVDNFIGCPGAGGKLMNIDIEGNVTVCISKAGLGNILDEPFETIYRRFASQCNKLKVGFFCCEVGREQGKTLGLEESRRALSRFYARTPDADWQETLNTKGWLIRSLFPGAPD